MTAPTITQCRCGQLPQITESMVKLVNVLRIECACGRRGATLMYTKPGDRDRMVQAAADGWNLGT